MNFWPFMSMIAIVGNLGHFCILGHFLYLSFCCNFGRFDDEGVLANFKSFEYLGFLALRLFCICL